MRSPILVQNGCPVPPSFEWWSSLDQLTKFLFNSNYLSYFILPSLPTTLIINFILAPIFKPDGSLSNIRARFEQGINPNNVKDSSGLTVAQQRVLEEQTRWNAERKQQQQQREQQEDEEQSRGKSGSSDTVKSVNGDVYFNFYY